ncbi:MAG: small-conductance mechanosensitive channel, partial [Candidatus Endobugula sp.]
MSLPTDLAVIQQYAIDLVTYVFMWLSSPTFYAQCAFVIVAVASAYIVGRFIVSSLLVRKVADIADDSVMRGVKQWLYDADDLIKLLVNVVALAIAIEISLAVVQQDGLIRFAQGVAMAFFCRALITRYVVNGLLKTFFKWTVLPMVILYVVGWLERTVSYLDSVSLGVGNIEFSLYGIFRAVFFGLILFWLGRASNNAGQQFIRQREDIDIGTKEVFAKLFE